jgi:protein subunit release factor B
MELNFIEPSTSKLVGQKRSRAAGKKPAANKRARKLAPSKGKSQEAEDKDEDEDEKEDEWNSETEDNE